MKTFFISDLLSENSLNNFKKVEVLGWVKNKRVHKNLIFLDVCDSTGEIQVIVDKNNFSVEDYSFISCLKVESSVSILGLKKKSPKNITELIANSICVVGGVSLDVCPSPRSDFDIFNECYTDTMLKYRHLYLRNPKIMAILHFRNLLKSILRDR